MNPHIDFSADRSYALALDEQDELKDCRHWFKLPVRHNRPQIYFLGNSLGLQPIQTTLYMQRVMDGWSQLGVEGFFEGEEPWLQYHDRLTHLLAPLMGAHANELVIMNQLTVNLHLMMASFYRPQGARRKIICEAGAFPSDQYMLQTYLQHLGLDPREIILEVKPAPGAAIIEEDAIVEAIAAAGEELALVLWGGINYYTGQLFDLSRITQAARAVGAMVGFDLAHAAGNVPLQLHDWNIDFACWCSYKYLNSGPGAIAGAYIHERYHSDPTIHRLGGWWGYPIGERFKMLPVFKAAPSATGWQLSTPSPLLYACHHAALDLFHRAGWERLQSKTVHMQAYARQLLEAHHSDAFTILTPHEHHRRGAQLSLFMHRDGKKIFDALTQAGVMADWREPNVIRIAPVPLYNSFEEIWQFANILKKFIL